MEPFSRRPLPVVSDRLCLPRLVRLTLVSGYLSPDLTEATFPVDLTNLQHVQLPRPLALEPVYERFYRGLILPSARTLRCIHINFPSVRHDHNALPPIPRLGEYTLPNLQCLEVFAEWNRETLKQVLTWLSSAILTPTSALSSQALKISVLTILGSHRKALTKHIVLWEEMRLEDRWSNLRLASVAAYAALKVSEFPEDGFVDVVPL
ncbi:hypothetical protein BKA70DRAFT_1263182 [Coprinopsis sp. MPI-PUGE-AT-0042]|nr:hypothetical protein BKA70DRAFT_1263182 [Coprinopsis sp. MPI-PUGE-AT-0042]